MRVGQAYELHITNVDPPGNDAHGFGGISALGMSGATLDPGDSVTRTVRPAAGQARAFPYGFACGVTSCGEGHTDMVGTIRRSL